MNNIEKTLVKENEARLLGRRIASIRYMTDEEQKSLGWSQKAVVLILDDGSLLFPMADDEGNDAGAISGQTSAGMSFTIPVL